MKVDLKLQTWLNNQVELIAGVKPYKCDFDNCAMVRVNIITTHNNTTHIFQAFTSNSALKIHQMVHTREKPFQVESIGIRYIIPRMIEDD